jgi:hypoxanthine phosphoribosyltransferase
MTGSAGERRIDVIYSAAEIAARVEEIATEIARREPRELFVIVVLKGSFVFAADLIRALDRAGVEAQVDFITLSSYGKAAASSGSVRLSRDVSEDVRGRNVMIVDDILDTGRTIRFARELMQRRGAASVKTCVLLDKPSNREVEIAADYVGFTIPNLFVVGYGLDLAHRYRGLSYIGVVRQG